MASAETIETLRAERDDLKNRLAVAGRTLEGWSKVGLTAEEIRRLQVEVTQQRGDGLLKRVEAAEAVVGRMRDSHAALEAERGQVAIVREGLRLGVGPDAEADVLNRASAAGVTREGDEWLVGGARVPDWLSGLQAGAPHLFGGGASTSMGGGTPGWGAAAPEVDPALAAIHARVLRSHGVPE